MKENEPEEKQSPKNRASSDESLAVLSARDKRGRSKLGKLTPAEAALLRYEWPFWARSSQLPPSGEWGVWLLMTGRGFGKTRAGAQWVIDQAKTAGTQTDLHSKPTTDPLA